FQRVAPGLHIALPVTDLRPLPEGLYEQETLRLSEQEARRAFDLGHGPLLRACLLRLREREHVLLVTIHHIVCDGWSLTIFAKELAALYEAISLNQASPLADLPVQYADFASWQRQWLSGGVLGAQLPYWKQHLDGAQPLELPGDKPRPAVGTYQGDRE